MDITYLMTLSATILIAFLLGGINALFSYFLDYCFWEGSIFGFWLPFNAKTQLKIWKPKKYTQLQLLKDSPEFDNMLIDSAQNLFFYKILGGCLICTNIWVALASFFVIHSYLLPLSWIYFLPYTLFSSYILRKIAKD